MVPSCLPDPSFESIVVLLVHSALKFSICRLEIQACQATITEWVPESGYLHSKAMAALELFAPQATPVAGRYYPFWRVLSEKGEKPLTNRRYETPSKEELYWLAYL